MVRLNRCWKRFMWALLTMSSEQIVWRLQAHADVKPVHKLYYYCIGRDPNAASAMVQGTIAPPTLVDRVVARYLIVKGMMRSLANVHCELFVPPPNGVVLFKDA